MNRQCSVSVWVGRGENRRVFNHLLEYRIANEGLAAFQPCLFCQAYGIGSYDPDQFGGRFFPKDLPLPLLFHETTFASEVTAVCANIEPANCYVLLFDYEYAGRLKDLYIAGFKFSFIGVYRHRGA